MRECAQCRYNFGRGGRYKHAGMTFVPRFKAKEMEYHRGLVHGPLRCPLCEFRYEDIMQRQRHLKRVHQLCSAEIKVLLPPMKRRRALVNA